jgi:hypothetical protein
VVQNGEWKSALDIYFDVFTNMSQFVGEAFTEGDVILWDDNRHHVAIATGDGHKVSQWGRTVADWNGTDTSHEDALGYDNIEDADDLSLVVPAKAPERNRVEGKPSERPFGEYKVYRIKDDYRRLLTCNHRSQVTLNFSWIDDGNKTFRPEVPGTQYESVEFSLWVHGNIESENIPWIEPVFLRGGRSHIGCAGTLTFELNGFDREVMTNEELKARARIELGEDYEFERSNYVEESLGPH